MGTVLNSVTMSPIEWRRNVDTGSAGTIISFYLHGNVEVTVEVSEMPSKPDQTFEAAELALMSAALDALKNICSYRAENLVQMAFEPDDGIFQLGHDD